MKYMLNSFGTDTQYGPSDQIKIITLIYIYIRKSCEALSENKNPALKGI